jgi:beta-lactamase superfamily II metal-dependent hydrolase
LTDSPGLDVIEVSIFGPGKGESVVAHLGQNEWIIVDSCISSRTHAIPALEYLEQIGVDASTQVRLVVGTHAHDDHFAGLAKVLERCESAYFVCQGALVKEQFLALVEMDKKLYPEVRKRALAEYGRIFDIVQQRAVARGGMIPMKFAGQERVLLDDSNGTRVLALSPSDQAHARSLQALADAFAAAQTSRKGGCIDPNELAIALWIEAGDKTILLGADLLKGPAGCGWGAILDFFRPPAKASVYKVAHHGSANAHHDGIWEQLLVPDPVALLAPYRPGKPVPSPEDRKRICGLSNSAYITAKPDLPAPSREVRREIADLGPLARNAREPWGKPGQVRARSGVGQVDWDIQLISPASRLTTV